MTVRSVAVCVHWYIMLEILRMNSSSYQSPPARLLAVWAQRSVETRTRMDTHSHTWQNGWQQTHIQKVRCEGRCKSKCLYLIAQQRGVQCSAYFKHVQIQFTFLGQSFCFQVFFSSLALSPPLFCLLLGVSPRFTVEKKKKRINENQLKSTEGRKKSSLIFWFWSCGFSVLFWLSPVCWCTFCWL